jgi:hypothetical protein
VAGGGSIPMLAGRLLVEFVRMIPGAVIVTAVGFGFGGETSNGLAGIVVMVGLVALLGVSFTGVFYLVAIATEDPQTFFAPTAGAPAWFDTVASLNPFTPLLDGTRSILAATTDVGDLAIGLGVFAGIGAATYGVAARSFAGLVTPD